MTPLIALAAGGTGGHMFPAEALAQELKRRGRRVLLVTDARGARYASNFPADERFEIPAASPNVGGPVAKLLAAAMMARGYAKTVREFRRRKISAAVGFGGYPSLPAMKAAASLRIPYGVHEQNGVLGRSNRMLAQGAVFTAHAFPHLSKAPGKARLVEAGNPVRDAVEALRDAPYAAPTVVGPVRLLIFGGSQGASILSRIPIDTIENLPSFLRSRLDVVHQVRESEIEDVKARYRRADVKADVAPFFSDLPARIAQAHLVVARAGASTVTELATIGRPSILVPLAIAMDDHQTGNARTLSDAGAGLLIPEAAFTVQTFSDALAPLLQDGARLAAMAEAARGTVRPDAARTLADLIDEMTRRGKNAA